MRVQNKERLQYLDMAKGIGIILVVIGHSTYAGESLLTWIASFHMPLFFIISGMLLRHTGEEEKKMSIIMKKKLKSIMLPYLSFSVIYLLMDAAMLMLHAGSKTFIDFFYSMIATFTLYGISTLWFLPALLIGEIFFLYIRKHCNHMGTIIIGLVLAAIVGITHPIFDANYALYNAIYYLIPGYLIICLYRSATAYVFITFGYYIKNYLTQKDTPQIKEIALAAALFALGGAAAFANGRVDLNAVIFKNNLYFYIGACAGTMAVVLLCKNIKTWKPLLKLGRNSLIIMATHLDFRVMITAIRGASLISERVAFLQPYLQWLLVAVLVTSMEYIIIYIWNRYFYFLIGKKKPVSRKNFKVIK